MPRPLEHPDATCSPSLARDITIPLANVTLPGTLTLLPKPRGLVIFAHGSGSSRFSPRNRQVADVLHAGGLATLLFDLLSAAEEPIDRYNRSLRFDIPLLATRLTGVVDWACAAPELAGLGLGLFGASTGAAAALMTAAERPDAIAAVVSRGGRPDLAGAALREVLAPTLLIVGGLDDEVIALNRRAAQALGAAHALEIVPGATHLFEEPGTLDAVCGLALEWFLRHLVAASSRPAG